MNESEVEREVATVQYFADFVDPEISVSAVEPDPDDTFLEAAVAGDVAFLVSGDSHLLDLESYRDVSIVDPRTFLDHLDDRY